MVKYVIQRLIAAFFTFVVILIVVFFVLHSMPGDIIDFSPKLDPAIREMIMDKYHLNDSLIEQFQYTMAVRLVVLRLLTPDILGFMSIPSAVATILLVAKT